MRIILRCFSILLSILFCQMSVAQQADRITGFFPGTSFVRFAEIVERETSYRFYLKEADVADLTVNLEAKQDKLEDVLTVIFDKTDLKFAISKDKEVFISRGEKLVVGFPADYLYRNASAQSSAMSQDEFVRNRRYRVGVPGLATEATLTGVVTSLENQKPIDGAIVYEKESQRQTITNREGKYEIRLPKGEQTLLIQNIGGYTEQRLLDVQGDASLDIVIGEGVFSLSEVVVRSGALTNV